MLRFASPRGRSVNALPIRFSGGRRSSPPRRYPRQLPFRHMLYVMLRKSNRSRNCPDAYWLPRSLWKRQVASRTPMLNRDVECFENKLRAHVRYSQGRSRQAAHSLLVAMATNADAYTLCGVSLPMTKTATLRAFPRPGRKWKQRSKDEPPGLTNPTEFHPCLPFSLNYERWETIESTPGAVQSQPTQPAQPEFSRRFHSFSCMAVFRVLYFRRKTHPPRFPLTAEAIAPCQTNPPP